MRLMSTQKGQQGSYMDMAVPTKTKPEFVLEEAKHRQTYKTESGTIFFLNFFMVSDLPINCLFFFSILLV